MLQMNRSGMVTMIMFIWAHLVGPQQLHGIQSLPAEHIIKILMFDSLKRDRPLAPCGRKSGNCPAIRGPSRPEHSF